MLYTNQTKSIYFYLTFIYIRLCYCTTMSKISGRIGTHTVASSFEGKQITFSRNEKIHKKIENIWFVYFQRVSKSLKSCDAVFFNGTELVEFVIAQDDIGKIIDAIPYPHYLGGIDPLPWKKMMKTAEKHKWNIEDWQHVFEEDESEDEESEDEWVPGSEDESSSESEEESDDESEDESEDDEPKRKRQKLASTEGH